MEDKPTISGFFPYLNDWGTIGSLVLSLDSTLKKICKDYEIIIVDDGSNNKSKEILKFLESKFSKLRTVTHRKNSGYGGAIKSGIASAKMDWIFYTDGDAQYDPREILNLWNNKRPESEIVNGYKIKRNDPWYRVILGKIYHHTVKALLGTPIRDTDCDFRLMNRKIFESVALESNSGLICAEMIKKISDHGFIFQEVPVNHFWRTSGKSQFFNIKRAIKMGWGLFLLGKKLEWEKFLKISYLHKKYLPKSFLSIVPREILAILYLIFTRLNLITVVIRTGKNNEIVAFASYIPFLSELYTIVVDQKFQNRKIGLWLIDKIVARAKTYQKKALFVRCQPNNSIYKFYLNRGFRFDTTVKILNHYFDRYKLAI